MAAANELQAALEAALGHITGSHVEIKALALMPGGASQEMWRLDLAVAEGAWQGEYPLVMRRQVGSKIYDDALEPEAEFRGTCRRRTNQACLSRAHTGCSTTYWDAPPL